MIAPTTTQGVALPERPKLLEVIDLKKHFSIQRGFLFTKEVGVVRAVDGVSFFIREGETLGLVGESGCGKTTVGRTILRAYDPTAGKIWFTDQNLGRVNVAEMEQAQLRELRQNMQLIFQDPYSSLNPRMTLLEIIGEPLYTNGVAKGAELKERVAELLKVVGLRPEYLARYPHAFSGGQRQRIGVARALALRPQLVVCDEPVSALDVSVQAQILNLLQELQEHSHSYLFISHDLSVVGTSAIGSVMYVGKLVESATEEPATRHPYTEALPSPCLSRIRASTGGDRDAGDVADPSPAKRMLFHPLAGTA